VNQQIEIIQKTIVAAALFVSATNLTANNHPIVGFLLLIASWGAFKDAK
jgi:hypothetical protein